MNPLSPIPAVLAFLVALATTAVLAKLLKFTLREGGYTTIDGLRGVLGFTVFLHHASIWLFYIETGRWTAPASHLYQHFGRLSVLFFFMITGFLFTAHILRRGEVDWTRLFVSRFLRLVPLYVVVMAVMFVIVGIRTDWQLREPLADLLRNLLAWLLFARPDVNQLPNTFILTAGVTWTLRYEWAFYFLLPGLALVLCRRVPWPAVAISGCTLLVIDSPDFLKFFAGGILAAFLVRAELFRVVASHGANSSVILLCIYMIVRNYDTAFGNVQIVLATVAFGLIAGGNTLYGLLSSRLMRLFGEFTYSIYLLHGLLLYVVLGMWLYPEIGATVPDPLAYWAVILSLTPVLIGLSMVAFKLVERPAMNSTDALTARLRRVLPFL